MKLKSGVGVRWSQGGTLRNGVVGALRCHLEGEVMRMKEEENETVGDKIRGFYT